MAEQEFDPAEVAAAIARYDQGQAFLSEVMPGVVEEVRGHTVAGMIDPDGAMSAAQHQLEAHMSQDEVAQVAFLAMAQLAAWILQAEKLEQRIADRDAASHIMTITDGVPEFVCTAPADAKCHQYPDCECEHWGDDHEHPIVAHERCWLSLWFSIGTGDTAEMYSDHTDERFEHGEMPQNAKGVIEIEFDECPLWSFTDLAAALVAAPTPTPERTHHS